MAVPPPHSTHPATCPRGFPALSFFVLLWRRCLFLLLLLLLLLLFLLLPLPLCRRRWAICSARCHPTHYPRCIRSGATRARRSFTLPGFFSWWRAASEEEIIIYFVGFCFGFVWKSVGNFFVFHVLFFRRVFFGVFFMACFVVFYGICADL